MRRTTLLLFLATLLIAPAAAQPLAELAPADTVLTLSLTPQQGFLDTLPRDLAELDWEGAGDTLQRLVAALPPGALDDLGDALDELGEAGEEIGSAIEEITEACPPLAGSFAEPGLEGMIADALLTVSVSPFNPMPAVTAFARVSPDFTASAAAIHESTVACFSDLTLDQDGVSIHVIGDGGDQPVALARISDDVYLVGTNPDTIRGAIRLAAGSDEPSLADTGLWQEAQRMSDQGLGFSLSFAPLADLVAGLAGSMPGGPEMELLLGRATAALRTLGGVAGRISADPSGLLMESVVAIDPAGGDSELARLLRCDGCGVAIPLLAPSDSVSVNSQALPLRDLFAYLQGWLEDLSPLVGEDLDLKGLLRSELGLDLDRALLGWIGPELHMVQLEGLSPDLGVLLYQPAQITLVPVSSAEAARDGLGHLFEVLGEVVPELLGIMNPMAGLGDFGPGEFGAFGAGGLGDSLAFRSYDYRGVEITRIQASLNLDLGIAFIDNYLIIAMPSDAAEAVVDTSLGARNILDNAAYREARDAAADGATAVGYADGAALMSGVVELADLISQPLAFGIQAGLMASHFDDDFGGDFGGDLGFADLTGLSATPLAVPATTTDSLSETDENNFFDISRYYQLDGVAPGDLVTVTLTSENFDTYLYLIDADSEFYLDSDDDSPDTTRSQLSFAAQSGISYWIEVTSFSGIDTGSFELEIVTVPGGGGAGTPPAAVEPPGFSDLLELTDMLPRSLEILADHLGRNHSYTVTDGDTVYARSLIRIRW